MTGEIRFLADEALRQAIQATADFRMAAPPLNAFADENESFARAELRINRTRAGFLGKRKWERSGSGPPGLETGRAMISS